LSAYYTASAGPIPLVATGLGTNGPTPPIQCDHYNSPTIANGATTALASPISTGDAIVICGVTISFQGAPSAGTIFIAWNGLLNCTGTQYAAGYNAYTSASTPQTYSVPFQERGYTPGIYPCFNNGSGVSVFVSVSYASVRL
jgi:hypothetical protein